MKKKLYVLTILAISGILILLVLDRSINKPNKNKNGFTRMVANTEVAEIARAKLKYPIYRICGVKGDSIFCSGKRAGEIFLYTHNLCQLDTIDLEIPFDRKTGANFYTTVRYPSIYIFSGNAKKVVKGNLTTRKYVVDSIPTKEMLSKFIFINSTEYIVRAVDTSLNAQFEKMDLHKGLTKSEENISETLADGGIINDGMLHFDKHTNKLVYVSFYSNNIYCMDTSLKLVSRSHTIDTISKSPVEIVRNKTSLTRSKPTSPVNSESTVSNGVLYVRSRIIADNENRNIIYEKLIIDRYDQVKGDYLGSFYLNIPAKHALTSLHADNNFLYAIYDKTLIKYELNIL